MFAATSVTGQLQQKETTGNYSNKKLLSRVWKIIHSSAGAVTCGAAAGSYLGYTLGSKAIDASVRYACNRFLHGFIGRLVGAIAAPFFASYLANAAIPVAGVAGSVGTLGIYHSARWIYGCCHRENSEINAAVLDNIKLIVKTLVLTSALDTEKADAFMYELYIQNPQLASIIMECLEETVRDFEEKKMMEDGFEMIGDFFEDLVLQPFKLQIRSGGELSADGLMGEPE